MSASIHHVHVPAELGRGQIAGLMGPLQERPNAGCFVFSGEAECFCRGLDFSERLEWTKDELQVQLEQYGSLLTAIRGASRPSIALVQGEALGGGVGIAAICDAVIATKDATFALPEALFGFYPAMVFAALDQRMSTAAIHGFALSGASISASDALRFGLVDEVVASDDAEAAVSRRARILSRAPSSAVLAIKSREPARSTFAKTLLQGIENAAMGLSDSLVRTRIRRFTEEGVAPWIADS